MDKKDIKKYISELVSKGKYFSEREIMSKLKNEGISVSQPTMNRYKRDINLKKNSEGYYVLESNSDEERLKSKLEYLLQNEVRKITTQIELLYIGTSSGSATMIGHLIKKTYKDEVVGTMALGDGLIVFTKIGKSNTLRNELREKKRVKRNDESND
ncbi:hypothetical protein [Paenibacillus sp. OK003]|uniref:hypothetical protein n=1 Tax=Paenibacillus sp. OK003 TaxID=1884380 RepID=UPI0008B4529E|nr:hypothetical protein [Paenibacillus sp. OK003]SEL78666.1 transcriptional regulator, ArgR family [Paenibacillus sp. OK003]